MTHEEIKKRIMEATSALEEVSTELESLTAEFDSEDKDIRSMMAEKFRFIFDSSEKAMSISKELKEFVEKFTSKI
jgi:sugar-specific transcriptional regulator TrmB